MYLGKRGNGSGYDKRFIRHENLLMLVQMALQGTCCVQKFDRKFSRSTRPKTALLPHADRAVLQFLWLPHVQLLIGNKSWPMNLDVEKIQ